MESKALIIVQRPTGGRRWEVRIRRADMPTDDADVVIGSFDTSADAYDHAATVRAAINAEAPGPFWSYPGDRDLTFEQDKCVDCGDMVGEHMGLNEATGTVGPVFTPCSKSHDDTGAVAAFRCDECTDAHYDSLPPSPLPAPQRTPAPNPPPTIKSVHDHDGWMWKGSGADCVEQYRISDRRAKASIARWTRPDGSGYTEASCDLAGANVQMFDNSDNPNLKTHTTISLHGTVERHDMRDGNPILKFVLDNGHEIAVNIHPSTKKETA